jgi:hypothetical protein
MNEHEKSQICPEDTIKILLPAKQIPHGSTVSKKTGSYTLTLNHRVRIFVPNDISDFAAQEIQGFFLQGAPQADLNQIDGDTELHWHVGAEDFKDYLEHIWEPTPQ